MSTLPVLDCSPTATSSTTVDKSAQSVTKTKSGPQGNTKTKTKDYDKETGTVNKSVTGPDGKPQQGPATPEAEPGDDVGRPVLGGVDPAQGDGHQIVCLIAEDRLTPAAKAAIQGCSTPT